MDYLWIYTSIAGALLGAACLAYVRETKIGLWGYAQFDKILDYLRDKYGLTLSLIHISEPTRPY